MLLLIPSQLFTLEEMQGIADIVAAHPNLTVIADEVRVCTTPMLHLLPL
jgi:bifunctional pyridoxal-dependent enzyme with beta-cystathionase and maltose regulon repressor activities